MENLSSIFIHRVSYLHFAEIKSLRHFVKRFTTLNDRCLLNLLSTAVASTRLQLRGTVATL